MEQSNFDFDTDLQKKWKQFHQDNPEVWRLFVRFTFDAINAGYNHYSVASVIERIRWHTAIDTKGDTFKINNNWKAYYARYFHEQFPKHDGFFRTRELS